MHHSSGPTSLVESKHYANLSYRLGREMPGLHALGAMYGFGPHTELLAQALPIVIRNQIKAQLLANSFCWEPGKQQRQTVYVLKQPLWLGGFWLNYTEPTVSIAAVSDNYALCLQGLGLLAATLGLSEKLEIRIPKTETFGDGKNDKLEGLLEDFLHKSVMDLLCTAEVVGRSKKKIVVME